MTAGFTEAQRRQLDFLVAAHGLTAVERLNRLVDGSRAETSAEHSWHLALLASVLARDLAPEVDLAHVLEMLLVHDVVEVDTGDVPIFDVEARLAVAADEEVAARRLFGLLGDDEGGRLLALWEEFEAASTPEARFARAVDRLQPMLVHWAGTGEAWAARSVTVTQAEAFAAQIRAWWPALGDLADAIVRDAAARGMLVRR